MGATRKAKGPEMPTQRRVIRPIERGLKCGMGAGAVVMSIPLSLSDVDARELHVRHDQERRDEGDHHRHGHGLGARGQVDVGVALVGQDRQGGGEGASQEVGDVEGAEGEGDVEGENQALEEPVVGEDREVGVEVEVVQPDQWEVVEAAQEAGGQSSQE